MKKKKISIHAIIPVIRIWHYNKLHKHQRLKNSRQEELCSKIFHSFWAMYKEVKVCTWDHSPH